MKNSNALTLSMRSYWSSFIDAHIGNPGAKLYFSRTSNGAILILFWFHKICFSWFFFFQPCSSFFQPCSLFSQEFELHPRRDPVVKKAEESRKSSTSLRNEQIAAWLCFKTAENYILARGDLQVNLPSCGMGGQRTTWESSVLSRGYLLKS